MSPLTLLINPPLPVMVAALMALLVFVFALTALLSKKATERLAKGQGEPSGVEAGLYWLHTVSKWGAIALLPYLCVGGIGWVAMNDNASRIFNQAGMVIFILGAVVIVSLAAVFIPVSLRMQTIEKNAAKEGADLENNREYKALKTLDNKLSFLHDLRAPFFLALVALAFFAIAKLFFNL